MPNAIIYTRFSPRPNAAECESCYNQEVRCFAYCKREGYRVQGTYRDEGVTGGTLDRPQLQAAITALEPGEILVVDSSDRLARDMLVSLTIRHQVEQAGARIEFADGSPLDTTPEGKLFQNILAAFAAYERDRIRKRTKEGLDRKRQDCQRTTGEIPIGWMLDQEDPKRVVRNEEEREAILAMCSWRSKQNWPFRIIADRLTGYIGLCRGGPWCERTVRRLIARHAFWADPVDGDLSLEPQHP